MVKIIKRDDTVVEFDQYKIADAINKAFIEVTGSTNDLAFTIADIIRIYVSEYEDDDISVEDIQNLV